MRRRLAAVLVCGAALAGTVAVSPPAPAATAVIDLGGRVTDPGFRGVVTSRGQQLGIARLADGTYGVCFDTGTSHPWPSGTPASSLRTDPLVGYVLSTSLSRARTDGRYAAALWWVTGLDLGVNRYPAAMRASIAQLRADSPTTYASVRAIHDRLLAEARERAAGRSGYHVDALAVASTGPTVLAGRPAGSGTVTGVGIRSASGSWLPGYPVSVTLSGATFRGGSSRVWRGTTGRTPLTVAYVQTSAVPVAATATVTRLPNHRYRLHDAHDATQRVGVSAGLASTTRTVRAAAPLGRARARKVDAATGAALSGATFTAWVDTVADGVAGPSEPARSLTTAAGVTSPVATFAGARVCFRETRAPAGYAVNPSVSCIAAARPGAAPAEVVVKDQALWRPELSTRVNHQVTAPGAVIEDAVSVRSTGGARAPGEWRLLGPVTPVDGACTRAAWSAAPLAGSGAFTATGDGTYAVGRHVVATAGCYTYVERLLPTPTSTPTAWTPPGLPAETTLVRSQPGLSTQVDRQVATAGALLRDTVRVSGTNGATVAGAWRLLGPVAARGASCDGVSWRGAPVTATGTFTAHGDGVSTVGARVIGTAGCYTYSESLLASPGTQPVGWTSPGIPAETSAVGPRPAPVPAHPTVSSGGRGPVSGVVGRAAAPARVQIGAVGLDASLTSTRFHGSDLRPPSDIRIGGLWADGAGLTAVAGTSVVVGHVSDDHDRPGAFKRLWGVRRGAVVTTRDHGATTRWRVVSVATVDRGRLPRSVFSQALARRLVLITCADRVTHGGYFHYTSNEVVVAVPVGG